MITSENAKVTFEGENQQIQMDFIATTFEFAMHQAENAPEPIVAAGMVIACIETAIKRVERFDPTLGGCLRQCMGVIVDETRKKAAQETGNA